MSEEALDNFVWHALEREQAELGEVGPAGRAGRFHPDVSPFCALAEESEAAWGDLEALLEGRDVAILMGPRIERIPEDWACLLEEVGTQWIAGKLAPSDAKPAFERLGAVDVPEMVDLAARTEPGPFLTKTLRFGRYWGLRREGELVAMAGERMRAAGFVEISAVCVDPAARREGLGGALTRFVAEQIRASGGRPMLHVREGNEAAIALYEGLGFVRRAERFVYALAPPGWERPETSAGDPS